MVIDLKGTYVLLIDLDQNKDIEIGSLGLIKFQEGNYAYVGSALQSLESRIRRHFKNEKKHHWHIDYLLSKSKIEKAIFGKSKEKKECQLAQNIAQNFPNVESFGSSDCKCDSHLFYAEDFSLLEDKVIHSFEKIGLQPEEW